MEFKNEDLALKDSIMQLVKNDELANRITQICLAWVEKQIDWGGKYDYLLEGAWGEGA